MKKQINIDKAAKQVEYNTKVRGMANDFAAGKASGRTLQSLATAEKERGLTSRFFRKITGQTTSVEAFNSSMDDLRQVEIAKELYAINPEVLEAANLVALKTGSPSAAAAAVGMNFTKEQREIILEKAKQGYKATFTTETKQDVNGQLTSIVTETTTSPNGTVIGKPKVTSSQVGDATKTLTTEEMSTILSNNNKIMENVVEMVGQEGKADFIKEAIKQGIYKDPSDMTVDDYLKLQQLSFDVAKYTKITPKSPISEEVAMARAEFLKSQESNLRIMGNDALPEAEKRAAQNEIILGLTMIEEAITKSSQSAAGTKPAVTPPEIGERMLSPNGQDILEFDGTNWVVV
jgi:hypothetical protein